MRASKGHNQNMLKILLVYLKLSILRCTAYCHLSNVIYIKLNNTFLQTCQLFIQNGQPAANTANTYGWGH